MQKFRWLVGITTILLLIGTACEKTGTRPPEEFTVRASLEIQTVDLNGLPVSVPVTIKIFEKMHAGDTDVTPQVLVQDSDNYGQLNYVHYFDMVYDEKAEMVIDVTTDKIQSVQYWTAYFSASDAPAKQLKLELIIADK